MKRLMWSLALLFGCFLAGSAACVQTPDTEEPSLEDTSSSSTSLMITCHASSTQLVVDITTYLQNGITPQVSGNPIYLEYGSTTDGWEPYTSGKQFRTWYDSTTSYQFVLDASVQNMNFFLYNPYTGQRGWFQLENNWAVGGDCYRMGGGIFHNTSTTGTGTLNCTLNADGLWVDINGPIQYLLVNGMVTNPNRILAGSKTYGWTMPGNSPALVSWNGSNQHTLRLPANTNEFNLYLDGSNGTGRWFDLKDADSDGDMWTVGGACYKQVTSDGAAIYPSISNGTIYCLRTGSDLVVTLTGTVPYGIFNFVPGGSPVYLEYGSGSDGWGPYTTSEKPKAAYYGSTSHTLTLKQVVQNFNFFLYGVSSGEVRWFDLNRWNITGDCYRSGGGGGISHY